MLLFNNTFQLVKVSFFNPALTLNNVVCLHYEVQAKQDGWCDWHTFEKAIGDIVMLYIPNLEKLVDLVKRMSVQDFYSQTNVQLEGGAAASEHHGDNETEIIKLMEFHIKAADEDAAGSNQVGIAGSRPRRARQLTEKERKYQAELLLEKRTKAMTRLQRKARAIEKERRTWTVFRYFQAIINIS